MNSYFPNMFDSWHICSTQILMTTNKHYKMSSNYKYPNKYSWIIFSSKLYLSFLKCLRKSCLSLNMSNISGENVAYRFHFYIVKPGGTSSFWMISWLDYSNYHLHKFNYKKRKLFSLLNIWHRHLIIRKLANDFWI